MDSDHLSFRGWLLATETSVAEMPELQTAVQGAVQSGQDAQKAVKDAMMTKLADPKVDIEKVADIAKMADKLNKDQTAAPGAPAPMQAAMKKKMKKKMKKRMGKK